MSRKIRIGLNGFGRIGRAFCRIVEEREDMEIVAINTRSTTSDMLAYLLSFDSVYGRFGATVSATNDTLVINGRSVSTFLFPTCDQIPWDQMWVDVVVDATWAFKTRADLVGHLRGNVNRVILTCPAKDDTIPTVVLWVNSDQIQTQESIFSMASCTTNCAAPILKLLDQHFGITQATLTTVHAYTSSQSLVDEKNKTPSRSRAAALNIVPTTTWAAKAVAKVLPQLKGKLQGFALRVPVPSGSLTDLTVLVERSSTLEQVHEVFRQASLGEMQDILGYATHEGVSSDYIGDTHSSIYDPNYTTVQGNLIKIMAWYDNEWGYSSRLADFVSLLGKIS